MYPFSFQCAQKPLKPLNTPLLDLDTRAPNTRINEDNEDNDDSDDNIVIIINSATDITFFRRDKQL